MSFALPIMLSLLSLLPVFAIGYVLLVRRRGRRTAELAAQGFAPTAASLRLRKRRHVPYAIFGLALTLLVLAVARPQVAVSIPRREGTVILAFDVSNSMRADDLKPTRMAAAKVAARGFVEKQPSSIKVGIVAFSTGGVITQQPTNDKKLILGAINRLSPQGGTSLGQGIFTSLSAIAGKALAIDPAKIGGAVEEIDIGYFGPAAVVVLSDGENTSEPDPVAIAKLASVAGVTIYPIGIGSASGAVVAIDGFSVATALDEKNLKEIASVTNGTYFHAEDGTSLSSIYKSIDLRWRTEKKQREITGIFTGISTLLLAIGAGLSLRWFGRVV